MKKSLTVLAAIALLTACESQRPNGRCVGLNGDPEPGVKYEYSVRNVILGLVFVEMVVPPVIVVLKELKCPVQ